MKHENIEHLLLREAKVVFKYLIKLGATKEDAEDIVQETLYKTIKHIDAIAADKVKAWLFKVAINHYYNLYNKKKKQDSLPPETIETIKLQIETTEDNYFNERNKYHIHKALNDLKPSYKNLLVLKYFMDFSYKEIGEIVEMQEKKVKVYLYRARNKFKQIWEANYDER